MCSDDPKLGPLQDNGGPTFTQALLPGSPAIDAGDDAVTGAPLNLTTDQRGLPRKAGMHVDIGAYESVPASCAGDCNERGTVTVNDLLTMVSVALGNAASTACEAGDTNHDMHITIDEILAAVNNALNGCGSGQ
ncbi:MAG: choice-of-anchor Q domain-containing protein [Candidatus Binatia bacterium]